MIKKIFTLSLILVVFLVACQSAATSPTADESDQGSQAETATEIPPLPEVSPTPLAENAEVRGEEYCTVVSSQSASGATEESSVPSVSASDWVHGPEDAKVTIIEYGDFQ